MRVKEKSEILDKEQFDRLIEKLDVLTKLIAANTIAGKNFTEQVEYLTSVGMSASQIAATLAKPTNSVTALVSRIKRRKV